MSDVTQASNLPDVFPDNLGIPVRLQNREDFDEWLFYVKNALSPYNLDQLLDATISRPLAANVGYTKWQMMTKHVKSWLVLQIHEDVLEEFIFAGQATEYAHDALKVIRDVLLGHGHVKAFEAWHEAVSLKRSNFATIEAFVKAFRQAIQTSNELECYISPYCATLKLLHEVEPELGTWAAQVEAAMPSSAPTTVSEAAFQRVCRDAIKKGNSRVRRSAAPSAVDHDKKNKRSFKSANANMPQSIAPPIPTHQGEDLPEDLLPEKIMGIPNKLRGRENFDVWLYYIENALEVRGLQHLLNKDGNIPRPTVDDPTYKHWKKASLTVKFWLVLQVDRSIIREFRTSGLPIDFADDALKVLKCVLGYGHMECVEAYFTV